MISLDGSFGEGGGQILRTALALSACTGQAFSIDNIRAGRKKPGLMRQHLTCVTAAAQICTAEVSGAEIGSQQLTFRPAQIKAGQYSLSVGTAGSTMLVLQTILPPLLLADQPSQIVLQGGTHNPMAPTFHYIEQVYLRLVNKHFASCEAELEAWGFFPAGGGKATFKIEPLKKRDVCLELSEPGEFLGAETLACVAKIDRQIAVDESNAIVNASNFSVKKSSAISVNSAGPGNLAWVRLDFANSSAMFTGFGEQGVSRQKVAANVHRPANHFFASGAAVDEHLADQIIILMSLCGGGSFTTTRPSLHTSTNLKVIEKFLLVKTAIKQVSAQVWQISLRPEKKGE